MMRLIAYTTMLGTAACGSTGSSGDHGGGVKPGGWIYNTAWSSNRTVRTAAGTGQIEEVVWPNPPVDENTWIWEGNISPIDGDLVEQGETGRLWDQTFVLDAATGLVRDLGPPEVVMENEFRWSPDGQQVIFLRHGVQGEIADRLVRLITSTGFADTLIGPDEVGGLVTKPFWIGSDTVGFSVLDRTAPIDPMPRYFRLSTLTGEVSAFDDVPWQQWHVPLVSADRGWIAHWVTVDSTIAGGQTTEFLELRIYHRSSRVHKTLRAFPSLTTYDGSTSIAFSPDSRYVANCPTNAAVAMYSVTTGREVARWPQPHCAKLNWSWGPDGPPSP